jgi:excisionase family DNA binding protein
MTGSVALPNLLTMDQLAEKLGVTRRHVRRLVSERRIPFLRVGRFIRFDPAQIAEWLSANHVPDEEPHGGPPARLAHRWSRRSPAR